MSAAGIPTGGIERTWPVGWAYSPTVFRQTIVSVPSSPVARTVGEYAHPIHERRLDVKLLLSAQSLRPGTTSWPPWRIGLCWQATRAPSAGPYGMGGPVRRATCLPRPHAGGTNAINAVPRYAAERLHLATEVAATPNSMRRSEGQTSLAARWPASVRPTIRFASFAGSSASARTSTISLRHTAAQLQRDSRPHGPTAVIGWSSHAAYTD
jgi:hypothetical protein